MMRSVMVRMTMALKLSLFLLTAITGNNSPASGEYESIISEITGFTQVSWTPSGLSLSPFIQYPVMFCQSVNECNSITITNR